MPKAVPAWGSVPEKLNPNKTFQRTVKTAAELHVRLQGHHPTDKIK